MDLNKALNFLLKNIGVFAMGAVVGALLSALYVLLIWIPTEGVQAGLGIIALIVPVLLILGITGAIFGGTGALIIYCLFKRFRKLCPQK